MVTHSNPGLASTPECCQVTNRRKVDTVEMGGEVKLQDATNVLNGIRRIVEALCHS